MKIKELKAILADCGDDWEVFASDVYGSRRHFIGQVKQGIVIVADDPFLAMGHVLAELPDDGEEHEMPNAICLMPED